MGFLEKLGQNTEQVRVELPDPAQPGTTRPVAGKIKTRVANIAERVLSTAWQAFFGSLAAVTITDVASAKQAVLVALGTIVPALLSLVKNLFVTRAEG